MFDKTDVDNSGTLEPEELQTLIAFSFEKGAMNFDKAKLLEFSKKLIKSHAKDEESASVTFEEFEDLYDKILRDPEVCNESGSD